MRHRPAPVPPASEITPREIYLDRRRLIQGLAGLALVGGIAPAATGAALKYRPNARFSTTEPKNS